MPKRCSGRRVLQESRDLSHLPRFESPRLFPARPLGNRHTAIQSLCVARYRRACLLFPLSKGVLARERQLGRQNISILYLNFLLAPLNRTIAPLQTQMRRLRWVELTDVPRPFYASRSGFDLGCHATISMDQPALLILPTVPGESSNPPQARRILAIPVVRSLPP